MKAITTKTKKVQLTKFALEKVEKMVETGKKSGYKHFSPCLLIISSTQVHLN